MITRLPRGAPCDHCLAGVFLGGTIIDKLGGYQGPVATARTLKCCAIFAIGASSSAVLCAFAPKLIGADNPDVGFLLTIGLIASTLLFGGARLMWNPPALDPVRRSSSPALGPM